MVRIARRYNADIVGDNLIEFEGTPDRKSAKVFFAVPGNEDIEISLSEFMQTGPDNRFGKSLGYLKPLFRKSTIDARPELEIFGHITGSARIAFELPDSMHPPHRMISPTGDAVIFPMGENSRSRNKNLVFTWRHPECLSENKG